MLNEETRLQIEKEVQRQFEPVTDVISEIRTQNGALVEKVANIDAWRKGLWGNGAGKPGFLEQVRDEDRAKYEKLVNMVQELKFEQQRQQGRADLEKELEDKKIKMDQLKTGRLTRVHIWLAIVSSFAGAWTLTLIRPILHVMIQELLKQ